MASDVDVGGDRATVAYWDKQWSSSDLPDAANPRLPGLRNFVVRRFDELFRRVVGAYPTGARLAEVGCAQSAWLPYFAMDLGCSVTGIDYSAGGCAKAERILDRAGVSGRVICADMFEPPAEIVGAFDVVTSFGLVEHFDDTTRAIAALARLLAPGGTLLTFVPNMRGIPGVLQRLADPGVFDVHVPLTPAQLRDAHEPSGLHVVESDYFLLANFYVVNAGSAPRPATRLAWRAALALSSRAGWALESSGLATRANRWTSPYAYTVARASRLARTP